jgi:hypothetical protein
MLIEIGNKANKVTFINLPLNKLIPTINSTALANGNRYFEAIIPFIKVNRFPVGASASNNSKK